MNTVEGAGEVVIFALLGRCPPIGSRFSTTSAGVRGVIYSRYAQSALRYPIDLTDREWSAPAPFIPSTLHGGRPRQVDIRAVRAA